MSGVGRHPVRRALRGPQAGRAGPGPARKGAPLPARQPGRLPSSASGSRALPPPTAPLIRRPEVWEVPRHPSVCSPGRRRRRPRLWPAATSCRAPGPRPAVPSPTAPPAPPDRAGLSCGAGPGSLPAATVPGRARRQAAAAEFGDREGSWVCTGRPRSLVVAHGPRAASPPTPFPGCSKRMPARSRSPQRRSDPEMKGGGRQGWEGRCRHITVPSATEWDPCLRCFGARSWMGRGYVVMPPPGTPPGGTPPTPHTLCTAGRPLPRTGSSRSGGAGLAC